VKDEAADTGGLDRFIARGIARLSLANAEPGPHD
jgi:hypothetical protein